MNGGDDFILANDRVVQPASLRVERHELDEPHFNVVVATECGESDNLIIVYSTLHHGVDLHRREACLARNRDTFEHRIQFVALGQVLELFTIQRVEAHIDARQPGTLQIMRHQRQRRAIRGECQIYRHAGARGVGIRRNHQRSQFFDEYGQVSTHRGLATGEANAIHPESLNTDASHTDDFLIREHVGPRQPLHAFFGHAIRTPEIAAIGYRNAQVANRTTKRVDEFRLGRHCPRMLRRLRHGESLRPTYVLIPAVSRRRCHQHPHPHRRARSPNRSQQR